MADTNYKIMEDLGTIGKDSHGNEKKLVKTEWYGKSAVYEIRTFDKEKALKRPGMTLEELISLREILNKLEI